MKLYNVTFHKLLAVGIIIAIVISVAIYAYYDLTKKYYLIGFNMSETVKGLTIKTAAGQYVLPGASPSHKMGAEFIFSRTEWNNNITITGKNEREDALNVEFVISDLTRAKNGYRKKEVLILNQTTGAIAGVAVVELVSYVNPHHATQRE